MQSTDDELENEPMDSVVIGAAIDMNEERDHLVRDDELKWNPAE